MVWRRLRIAADTSLAALHFIFQTVQFQYQDVVADGLSHEGYLFFHLVETGFITVFFPWV